MIETEEVCEVCTSTATHIGRNGEYYCSAHKKPGCTDMNKQKSMIVKADLSAYKAMMELLRNPEILVSITCMGMTVPVISNEKLIPAIEQNINECNKFLNGEKSIYDEI